MYDFGLSCGSLSPEREAASLWGETAVPAIDFFLIGIGAAAIRFFRPGSSGRWNESLGTLHRYQSEIFFQVQGRCRFTFPAETLELFPGDVLLVPLGMPHLESACDCGGKKFFNLVLTVSEGVAKLHIGFLRGKSPKPSVLIRRGLPEVAFFRGAVAALSECPPGGSGKVSAALIEALLWQIAEDLKSKPVPVREARAPYSFASRAKSRLDEGGDAVAFDIGHLAAELGCSSGYLSDSFRKLYGIPLKLYIRGLRLEHARQLLSTGRCNVAETAAQCGFRDASYFSRQFRERFGVSPGKLR